MIARRWYVSALLPLIVTFLFARPAAAQTDEDHFQTLPFNFSNPGARPTAMGGAFIGLADDASAAVANPAGLTSLVRRQQVYLEYKHQQGQVGTLDYHDSLLTGFGRLSRPSSTDMPAFFNFATRLSKEGAKRAMTMAVSSHQFLSYKNGSVLPRIDAGDTDPLTGQPFPGRRTITIGTSVYPRVTTEAELSGFSYSGSLGFDLIPAKQSGDRPVLRGGLSVSANHLGAAITADRLTRTECPACAAIPSTKVDDSSWAPGMTVGLLYQMHPRVSLGFTHAIEPHFKIDQTVTRGTYCAVASSCTAAALTDSAPGASWSVPFNLPSRTGLGVAYTSNRLIGVFDVVRVGYSSLVEEQQLVLFRHIPDSFKTVSGFTDAGGPARLDAEAAKVQNKSNFQIEDSSEVRGGVEIKVKLRNPAIYIRYGAFYRPSHSITFNDSGCGFAIPQGQPGFTDPQNQKTFACPLVAGYYFVQANTALVDPIDPKNPSAGLNSAVPLYAAEKGVSFGAGFNYGGVAIDGAFSQSNYHQTQFVLSSTIRFELHSAK